MKICVVFFILLACSKEEEKQDQALNASNAASKTEEAKPAKVMDTDLIRGTISLIPSFEKNLKKDQIMFLFIRDFQSEQVVALKKIILSVLPYHYEIGKSDVVLPNYTMTGPFRIFAAIDVDGQMGAPQSGDMWGAYPGNPFYLGANNINIIVDTIQP